MTETLETRLRKAYALVALWPENRMNEEEIENIGQGFLDLLALRNLIPEVLEVICDSSSTDVKLVMAGDGLFYDEDGGEWVLSDETYSERTKNCKCTHCAEEQPSNTLNWVEKYGGVLVADVGWNQYCIVHSSDGLVSWCDSSMMDWHFVNSITDAKEAAQKHFEASRTGQATRQSKDYWLNRNFGKLPWETNPKPWVEKILRRYTEGHHTKHFLHAGEDRLLVNYILAAEPYNKDLIDKIKRLKEVLDTVGISDSGREYKVYSFTSAHVNDKSLAKALDELFSVLN